jgi:two-component system nitrogen regulation response regulator NtrX
MNGHILIVDDERGIRATLRDILQDEGYTVEAVESGERCLEVTRTKSFDLIILDIWMGEMDGLRVLEQLKRDSYPALVIMISGHGTIESAVSATRLGAWDFIEKPLSLDKTILVVNNALRQRKLEVKNLLLQKQLEERENMVGESAAMLQIRRQIDLAAPTDSRVFILGEHGTGKELVARAIHRQSGRAKLPFVEVNCAAIPEELIESELFGHVKGSFTGATEDKEGKFRAADGGTLFLDEIGDMSLKTQAKVLRALQEQMIEPVGSSKATTVDVRILTATNKNLDEEIVSGNFRSDLYFRINVIPIMVPPLRDRKEDIPLLVNHFIQELADRFGRKPLRLHPRSMELMRSYNWPGNVRELRNTVERLMIMTPDQVVQPEQLEIYLPISSGKGLKNQPVRSDFASLKEAREYYERQIILAKLEELNHNVTETAKALQVERSHLHRKIKSFGIQTSKS